MSAAKKLLFRVPQRILKLKHAEGPGSDDVGRVHHLRKCVSALFLHERLEMEMPKARATRQYSERLLQEAILRGDQDPATLELADFWLTDKHLVEKLFSVFVPRFEHYNVSYTALHRLPEPQWPHRGTYLREGFAVLELKGNPWPPVRPPPTDKRGYLINVLLSAAREERKLSCERKSGDQ